MNVERVANWAYLALSVLGGVLLYRAWPRTSEGDEDFSIALFSDNSDEEDVEIVIALKQFFDASDIALGHDGWTGWVVP